MIQTVKSALGQPPGYPGRIQNAGTPAQNIKTPALAPDIQQQPQRASVPPAPEPDQDRLVCSASTETALPQLLDSLKQKYPQLTVSLENPGSTDWRADAASLGDGFHMIISWQFLERMNSSSEEFGRCCPALEKAAGELARQAGAAPGLGVYVDESKLQFWSLGAGRDVPGPQDKAKEAAGAASRPSKNKSPFLKSSSPSFRVSEYYAKIARARSKGEVQKAMGEIHRQIASLIMAGSTGDSNQQAKASRAARSLKKLLTKGRMKIRRLNQQEQKILEQKKAEQHQEEEKARMIREERRRLRLKEKGKSEKLLQEGRREDGEINRAGKYPGMYGGGYSPSPTPAPLPMTGDLAVPDAGYTPADVIAAAEPISF